MKSQEVPAVLAEYASLSPGALGEKQEELRKSAMATDEAQQKALDRQRASYLIVRFEQLVRKGMLDKLADELRYEHETDGFARC